jgi:hypothetical protein
VGSDVSRFEFGVKCTGCIAGVPELRCVSSRLWLMQGLVHASILTRTVTMLDKLCLAIEVASNTCGCLLLHVTTPVHVTSPVPNPQLPPPSDAGGPPKTPEWQLFSLTV